MFICILQNKLFLKYPVFKVISHFTLVLNCFRYINISHFYLKKEVNVVRYDFRNGVICWQISKFTKCNACIFFTLTLAVSKIRTLKMFDLQKVGHGRGVLFSQCCPSMANINIYKSLLRHICASSHSFRDINV